MHFCNCKPLPFTDLICATVHRWTVLSETQPSKFSKLQLTALTSERLQMVQAHCCGQHDADTLRGLQASDPLTPVFEIPTSQLALHVETKAVYCTMVMHNETRLLQQGTAALLRCVHGSMCKHMQDSCCAVFGNAVESAMSKSNMHQAQLK